MLALYLYFEGTKNIHVLKVLIWSFSGTWRLLIGVWHLGLDSDMVTGLWYTYIPNFGSVFWIWRWKEHPYPLIPDLRLWLGLQVPDWGLASWSWFGYCHWFFIQPCFKFWLSILIFNWKRTSMSFKSWFRALMGTECSWLGFCTLILIWIWSLVFDSPIFLILVFYVHFGDAKNIYVL